MAYNGDPIKAIETFIGEKYIQHNPAVKNGIEGFIWYFKKMKRVYSVKSIEFARAISENDLITLYKARL